MTSDIVRPYRIDVHETEIDDLHRRLDHTRWPADLPGAGSDYGVPRAYLEDLVSYWRREFDWRAAESRLNAWPQFITEIDGASVHFAHIRSPEPDATPLILVHGWPGSLVEFSDIAPMLLDPRAHGGSAQDAFHLVIPSLPGFGFSGPTRDRGWDHRRIAVAFAELMDRLGYGRYLA